jgi:hypothetical protein
VSLFLAMAAGALTLSALVAWGIALTWPLDLNAIPVVAIATALSAASVALATAVGT